MQNSNLIFYHLSKKPADFVFTRLYRYLSYPTFLDSFEYKLKNKDLLVELLKKESYQPEEADSNWNIYIQKTLNQFLEIIFKKIFIIKNNLTIKDTLLYLKKNEDRGKFFIIIDLKEEYLKIDPINFDKKLKNKIKDERFIRLLHKFLRIEDLDNLFSFSKTYKESNLINTLRHIQLNELDYQFKKLDLNWIRYKNQICFLLENIKQKEEIKRILEDFNYLNSNIEIKKKNNVVRFLGYDLKFTQDKLLLLVPKTIFNQYILDNKLIYNLNQKPWIIKANTKLINENPEVIVNFFQSKLSFFYNYYQFAHNISQKMSQLYYLCNLACLKTLAQKDKSTIKKEFKKYRKGSSWSVNQSQLKRNYKTKILI